MIEPPDARDPIDQLVARDEIGQLAARYAIATDSRDLDALVALFIDDVDVGRRGTGRAALRASFDEMLRGIGRSVLFTGTHQIDLIDAEHATGALYTKAEIEVDGAWVHQAILYLDDYERRDGRWLFVRRRHELFYGAPVGQDPLTLGPAEWPRRAVGTGTRPEAWPTWSAFWADGGNDPTEPDDPTEPVDATRADGEDPTMYSGDFDEKAATWDDDPAKVERARAVARSIAAKVELTPSTRLLEYGAGTGLVTEALRDQVGPVTLADTSAGMREAMQAKIDAGTITDATVWSLDLSETSPPADRFDLIVTVMTLHHIEDLATVLSGFAELLDVGGRLCVVDLEEEDGSFHGSGFSGHHGFARPELADALRSAGFGAVEFETCSQVERHGAMFPLFLAACGLDGDAAG